MRATRISPQVTARLLEKEIQEACVRIFELDGWRRIRMEATFSDKTRKGVGEPGMADDLFIRYAFTVESWQAQYAGFNRSDAEVVWIEWKRIRHMNDRPTPRLTKATQAQKDWHTLERKCGALTLIAGEDFPATIEGFRDWYIKSGLMRNQIFAQTSNEHYAEDGN